jgi:hypothetical protein
MTRGRREVAGAPSESENARSPKTSEPARPWTDEEMAAAEPLPLPTVDPSAQVHTAGVPYAGKGETKPAGKPESDAGAKR